MIAWIHVAAPPLGDVQSCVACRCLLNQGAGRWPVGSRVAAAEDDRCTYRVGFVESDPPFTELLCVGAN